MKNPIPLQVALANGTVNPDQFYKFTETVRHKREHENIPAKTNDVTLSMVCEYLWILMNQRLQKQTDNKMFRVDAGHSELMLNVRRIR